MKRFSINLLKFSAISFIAVFLFLTFRIDDASAATRTWTGTTSGSWSVASNWGGTAPVTGDDLVFPAGASNLSNTNDFTENTIFNSITISGSGYTLSGNPIILGAGLASLTDSASSGGNTIALDIRLDVTRDIVVTNAAETLTISGRISGVGGINKEGLGKIVLSGANTFGGTLKINVGVVNAQNNTALGTIAAGTEIVGGAALELQGGIDISYEALALRGYGVSGGGALRNISNNNTFRGLITLSSAGGAEIASDSGTLTLAGGTTGNFPLVLDGASNITFSTTPIAGSGTVTKNGAGTVTLNFPNTNTGAWVINQGTLLYGVDNALVTNTVTVTGGTLDIATFSDMVGTVTLGTLDLASGTITGSTGVLSSATWTLYNGTISAIIAGVAGMMTKSTTGTVTLTRPNLYTGATTVSLGILKIQNSTALGTIDGITTVTAGATLEIDGSGLSVPEYITFSGTGHLYTGAIRNRTGDNTLTGLLTLGTAGLIEADTGTTLTIDGKGLSAANIGLVIGGAGNVTFTENAPIYGSGATLTKNDTGTLTLQGFNNFTGATNLTRGSIVLSGAGAMPNSAITVGNNATLTLDNSSTSVINRISDTAAFTMNGGTFNFIGNATSTALETAGALTLSSGHNTVTVTPGAGGATTMIFASLSRTAGATALFRGTNFGSNPASNISTLMFNTAPTLTGGGGSANSSTISIIKGVFGDGVSGTGSDMVTYNIGNSNGIRLLNGAGFSGEYVDTLTTNANVKLSANTPASTASINSLILNGFDITNPGSAATLTLASASLSGNILMNSADSIDGANTTLGITTNELPILATASGSISAVIGTAVAGSLTLSGPGTVTLSAANAYTGTTSINGTTLFAGASNVLSTGGLTIVGGTYDIGNFNESLGAVILQNGTITGGSGVLTSTASYSFREGTVSAIIAGSVAVTRIATSAAADSVVTMTRDNTYTGATTITSGILRLGGAGGGTNTPLGTTGGATTVANIAALDLNGYTLGTAEAISIAGLGYGLGSTVANGNSNMGAIMNTSSTPASYSGAITLTAAARINADAGALTISSAISGAFGLTIGGFSDSTFSGVIGTGTGTITKDGIGVLTLSNSNTYTGATTISTGTVKLGAAGGATNTPLGTTGAGTTVSTGARIDLNGFTLGTAEGLTLNGVGYGLGDFASGALINSSGSSVSYSGAVTLGSTGVLIKADSGNITLSGAFSGATFALTIGGTGSGTISGVIGTTTGTVTKIGTGTWTLSNAASTYTGATSVNLGTLKLGVSGGATNTPLGTTGGGTSVMSGAVLDFNGFTVGTAEALTINGRGINDGGAIIGANVTFAGTIAQATDSRITNASGTFTVSGAATGAFALYVGGAGNITFSAATGTAGLSLVKQGAGTLTLTGTNTHTGETRVDAGTLAYAATTTLAATNLLMKGGTFNNGANADTIGTVTLVGGTITNSAALTGTAYTLESGTISGIIAGAVAVTKNTSNTVTLSAANTISSTITINAGTLAFSGGGTATSVTGVTVNLGGTLTLDNSTTSNTDRLSGTSNNIVITMNGGNLNFIGNSAGTSSETLGQLALASGHNIVTVTPGAGGSTTLTFGSNPGFNRTAGATVLFRGTSFGSTPAANVSTLMFTTAPTLTGGGGGSSTTTISVIKAAFGDSSLSGTGSDMVTYNVGNTNGLRLLNGAGFSGEYAGDLQTANANVKLTADRAAVATNTNSLITNGFAITNPGSAVTIPVASASLAGNILINSANNIAGSNTTLGITTFELPILATASSTISAVIGTATTGALTLSGSGNATLSAANAYTGTTYVNNATLTYGASNVISTGGLTVVGGTVNLNGNSDTVGTISINAGTITTGAGTLTGNGTFSTVANNNAASIISGNLGLGANATFTINDGLMDNDALISAVVSGGFTFAKAGSGVLELSGSNTYTGTTTISAGTLRLGAAGGATNTPLGTTAGGTTVSGASSALDLNGYTLGTSEALTLSGALATGALQNTSSTGVNYTGLITLGAASTIISNYGDINITNTGTITGATFGLTIGGSGNGSLASILGTTSGTLTKNGLGVWTVSGSSTFTGLTTVSAGTLKLGASGGATNTPLGTTGGATSITSGAILDLNGYTLGTAEGVTINGTGIASIGAFINSSNNTISYTGAITMGANSRIANYGSGVWTLTGAISGNFALTTVTVGDITQSSASVWSGTGTLVKEGSGILILSGQNTMTGAMTVSTGVLQLGASGGVTNTPLGTNAGGVTVALGAVLDLSTFSLGGASTYETLNISGTGIKEGGAITSTASGANNFGAMTVTANALVKNSGSGLVTFGGTITAANTINLGIAGTGPTTISGVFGATATTATINKWDSGILTISAASITTGLVRINGGTLKYGVADALSTPAVTVAGGTLDLNGFNETNIGAVTLIDGSIINGGGAATLTSTATYTVEKGTISAVLGSAVAAGIAKNTAGRVTLSGNNTFTSTSIAINAGYLNLQNSNALGASGTALATTISGGATLELQNNITLPATKTITANGTGMGVNGAIRNISGTNVISANITLGTTNVGVHSDSGSLTIPTISGNTFSVIFGGAGNTTVSGAIGTTTGNVIKSGSGNLTLSGTNTYSGTTTALAGTIIANTTSSLGDGSATNTFIFRGGTLQATGTITSPSNRAFTLASNAVFDTNGNDISIAGTVGSAGGFTKNGSGTLTITGAITIGGDFVKNAGTVVTTSTPWTFSGNTNQSIDSITTTGLISMTKSGGTATLQGAVSGGGLTINGSGGTLDLNGFTHSFSGDVTLTAGTLVAGASTINLSSTSVTAWNGDGSLFVPGTSTVNFSGGNQTLSATNMAFNNLTFSGSGTKTLGSGLTVNGNLVNSGGSPSYATWNPSDKAGAITLSNGNLTETGDNLGYGFVRATQGKSSGKWYWELYVNESTHAYPAIISGTPNVDTGNVGRTTGQPDGWSISEFQTKWNNDSGVSYGNVDFADGDTVGVALNMDAGEITFYINNVSQGVAFTGLTGTLYPAAGTFGSIGALTANFGASAFTYTPPNGYNSGVYTGGASVTIATGNNPITLKGNFTNTGTSLNAGSSNITLDGTSTQSIAGFTTTGSVTSIKTGGTATFTGAVSGGSLEVNGTGGSLNLGSALTHTFTGTTTLTTGTLNMGSSNISTLSFSSSNSNTRTLTLGSGTISLTGTGTVWDMATSTNSTINPGTSTIKITDSSSSGKTFAGGSKIYNNFWFAPSTGTGSLTISGNNTFNDFKDNGTVAHSILFTTGSTQYISTWNVSGNPGQLITINSTTTGTHNLVKNASGGVTGDYLNIQHSVVSPYGGWFAGANSVDNQNVASAGSGWLFFRETIYRGGGGGGETDNGTGSGTCADGIQNGNETGIDTGGRCANTGGGGGGGSGGDGGGDNGTGSGTCADGIQNGNETGIDTGGRCGNTGGGGGGGGDSGFIFPRGRIFVYSPSYNLYSVSNFIGGFFRL